jgi:hypothetical protein
MSALARRSLRIASVLVVSAAALAPAMPGEPPGEKRAAIPGWGEAVDPDGDCTIRADASKLRIEVPGAYHDLWPGEGKVNAPRVLRPADGEFTLQVKVSGQIAVEKGTALPGVPSPHPFRAAGLLIWADEGSLVRLERASQIRGDKTVTFAYLQGFKDGKKVWQRSRDLKAEEAILRPEYDGIVRNGPSFRPDGSVAYLALRGGHLLEVEQTPPSLAAR